MLDDEELQLTLYVCYELHCQGFDEVDDDWEWNPAPAENPVRPGQAACSYSLRIPSRRWCLRTSRRVIWSGSVISRRYRMEWAAVVDALMGSVLVIEDFELAQGME